MDVNELIATIYGDEGSPEKKRAALLRGESVYTPPQELTPAGIMSTKLQQPRAPVGVAPAPNRPDVQALYGQMETLNNKPNDFSKLDEVNVANERAGGGNFARALAMQMFGGKTAQAPGKAMMIDAMDRAKPIRPNAADIGWTNQETGEFVQNPVMERQQKEKVIAGRIDALVKEQERRHAQLLAEGKLEEAKAASRNAEQMKLIQLGILSGNQQITAMLTGSKMSELENRHGDGKPLATKEVEKLTGLSETYSNLDRMLTSFKDEYSPQTYAGKPGVLAENWAQSNFPKVMTHVGGPKDQQRIKDQAEWWRAQESLNNLPERHASFGATLTAGETAAWNAASIQPGMDPALIRKHMATRKKVLEESAARLKGAHIANRKNPKAVRSALSAFTFDDDEVDPLDAELAKRNPGGK